MTRAPADAGAAVANAGLVLASPYLPRLFERLGVLAEDNAGRPRINGPQAASRAVHLLQYLADGRLDTPEPELLLNKVLCGLPARAQIEPSIAASAADLDICDGLIGGLLANWPALKDASPDSLRATFFRRDGRLSRRETGHDLRVTRKTVDVLVGQLPWSFAIINHPWMAGPLHVSW